jgi:hypothetical protein
MVGSAVGLAEAMGSPVQGSFGQAWKVRHAVGAQVFVAKQIKCANKQDLDEALGEASVLSKLNHPFIVA